MWHKRSADCTEITAKDGSRLRELVHPERDESGVPYSVAVASVSPKGTTIPHRLEAETEVYYILQGEGLVHVGEQSALVGPGDVVLIPPQTVQWVENTGNHVLKFLALVSPPWREDHDQPA